MRKLKEIFRLHFAAGLSARQIARSCSISRPSVKNYLRRAAEAGLRWDRIEPMGEVELTRRLFPSDSRRPGRALPDFAWVDRELRRPHVTRQLLWQEYKLTHPDGLQYSQFCDAYRKWKKTVDVVLRQTHRAGEKMFVDYAGQTVPITDPGTGRTEPAFIFVAVLGASNYTYAEAALRQDGDGWISAHVHAFEFFGGTPRAVVPDNAKTAVKSPCYYEPDVNATYADLAAHYQTAVLPARCRKPRDKAKVESGVLVVERWILAALRNRTFFSVSELNQAIRQLLVQLNDRPFKKLPGTRRQLFERIDRPALKSLPPARYQIRHWKMAAVNIDYHVELDRHYYSVPYGLSGRRVEIWHSKTSVSILHQGQRVAVHRRSYLAGGHTTDPVHRPECHRRYLEWTPSRLIAWGGKVGPQTARAVQSMLVARRHPEQAFRSCLGLLRLAGSFGEQRLEAACARAVTMKAVSYKSVKSILQTGLDRQPLPRQQPPRAPLQHPNLRGSSYFCNEEEEEEHVR